MRTSKLARTITVLLTVVVLAVVAVGPVTATEAGGAGGEEGRQKMQIAETPHEKVGLLILAALVIGGGVAFVNARKQLKGERDQATGEFRWR